MPPYGHLPWKTYFVRDVTSDVKSGANLLAVEVIRYGGSGRRLRTLARRR